MRWSIKEENLEIGRQIEYTYDGNGNILNRREDFLSQIGKLQGLTDMYDWEYTDSTWTDLLTKFNGQTITYDEIGNPLNYRDGMNFTWEKGRRLSTVNDNISYTYDENGIRTSKTVDGVTTYFYLNGSTISATKTNDDLIKYYYDENGALFAFERAGVRYYYLFNLQGDVIGITNPDGNLVGTYLYDSWGKLLGIYDANGNETTNPILVENPFRYRAYYYDNETGLYYLQSRYYDPVVCRFINEDSLLGANQDMLSYNIFAYCSNNPINHNDPTGHNCPCGYIGCGLSESNAKALENSMKNAKKLQEEGTYKVVNKSSKNGQ